MDKMLDLFRDIFPQGNAIQTGQGAWKFSKGSADIHVKIIKGPSNTWFHVTSEIMRVPHQNLLKFYRVLLELNGPATLGASFSIHDNYVFVSMLRPVEGLDTEEIRSMVTIVAEIADKYDDELKEKFLSHF